MYLGCLVVRVERGRIFFFFSSRRRHTRLQGDWSSDVCSSDLGSVAYLEVLKPAGKYARRLKRDSLIWKDQAVGGPYFEIAQVLTACRIDNAIVEQSERARDASAYMPVFSTVSDALMLPDGGFWVESQDSHWSHRVAQRTYQGLAADRWSIDDPHVTTE